MKRKYSFRSVNSFEMNGRICYMAVKMLRLSVDGGPWHHLNEREIGPNQGVFSEWMKFQSGNSCLRGKGRTHFCISSHGWSYRLDWCVKQAFYLRTPPCTLIFFRDLPLRPLFHSPLGQWRAFQPRAFTPSSNYVAVTSWKCCSYLLCNVWSWETFCTFVSLYYTTSSYKRRAVHQYVLRNTPTRQVISKIKLLIILLWHYFLSHIRGL